MEGRKETNYNMYRKKTYIIGSCRQSKNSKFLMTLLVLSKTLLKTGVLYS